MGDPRACPTSVRHQVKCLVLTFPLQELCERQLALADVSGLTPPRNFSLPLQPPSLHTRYLGDAPPVLTLPCIYVRLLSLGVAMDALVLALASHALGQNRVPGAEGGIRSLARLDGVPFDLGAPHESAVELRVAERVAYWIVPGKALRPKIA